ncbi:MAG: ribose transporter substrate-binding protein [Aeromicrobium sp.]|jgi:ribose transport system substrate-binding protein|nr:ribose transporter substrate-binding protein [Aeromicrobium sp.]
MKTNSRRAGLAITTALTTIALAACSGGSSGGGTDTVGGNGGKAETIKLSEYCGSDCVEGLAFSGDQEAVKCTVGISQNSLQHPYGVAQKKGFEAAAKAYFPNMKLIITDAQGDSVTQSNQVQDMVTRGIDVLLITPFEADSLVPAVKAAVGAKVKVITHDRTVNTPVLTELLDDNEALGKAAGQYFADRLGAEGGNVVMIKGSLGASATNERTDGFMSVVKSNPAIKIVATQTGNYVRTEGLTVMQDYLQRFPKGKLTAVYAQNDEMALGARQAIQEAGRDDDIWVYGLDGSKTGMEAVKSKQLAGTVVYPTNVPEGIVAAAKACSGESMPKQISLTGAAITPENVDKYLKASQF